VIGKEEFNSPLLLWLMASLPLQALSWLDRPTFIHRHIERTDLKMRAWLAAVDTVIAFCAGFLGLEGIGVALLLRFVVSRLLLAVWFGDRGAHFRMRYAWPVEAAAVVAGVGIAAGEGRTVLIVVSGAAALLLVGREVGQRWIRSSSIPAMRGDP
jgi:hypothetical protein